MYLQNGPNIFTDTPPKKTYRWQMSTWNDAPITYHQGNANWSPGEWTSATVKWHHKPIGMVKICNFDNIRCWWGCGATRSLMHRWWKCKMVQHLWKKVWYFLRKLNILLPWDPAIVLLVTQMSWKLFSNKNLHLNAYSIFIHNCPNLKATMMSFNSWVNSGISGSGVVLRAERNELSGCEKTGRDLKCTLFKCEKPIWKVYVLCDLTVQPSKKDKTVETLKR